MLTIPNIFGNKTGTVPAQYIDDNFIYLSSEIDSLILTGATGRAGAAGANIASATTIDLTAATGNVVVITGTATTTALTMTAGQQMILLPSDAWPMTFNATQLNINGGASYTCTAGDRVFAVKDLAGVIRVTVLKADGTAITGGIVTTTALANAAATLTAAQLIAGDFTITPTVARILTTDTAANIIAAFTSKIDNSHFQFTVVNNAAFDVTIALGVGVTLVGRMVINNGSATFRVRRLTATTVSVTRVEGATGKLLQVVSVQNGAVATGTAILPYDDTIPQVGEGTQFMSLAFTPVSASSRLLIVVVTNFGQSVSDDDVVVALFNGAVANALAATITRGSVVNAPRNNAFSHVMDSAGAMTFTVRAGPGGTASTVTFNGRAGVRDFAGVMASSITITEYIP